MKIRAITLGQSLQGGKDITESLAELKANLEKLQELREAFTHQNIEVQYIRLATEPFTNNPDSQNPTFLNQSEDVDIVAKQLESFVEEGILGIYSLSPGICDYPDPLKPDTIAFIQSIPKMLATYPNAFSSIQVASSAQGINFQAIHECAKLIITCSEPDPFLNLKLAITMNVAPNTPFFPSAYHMNLGSSTKPKISIALEAADELVTIFEDTAAFVSSLSELRDKVQARFITIYDQITGILEPFCTESGFIFEGIDFSPAPYPTYEKSIGTVLEKLGFSHFGEAGSTFAVGFLTQALQSIDRPKIGFSGFMQPLLEDFTIGKRNNEGKVSIEKLMLFSTQCGLGLDCIPIPGDTDATTIALLLMDLAMMSIRLNKPLTARLMPIPGKSAGELTDFDFEFFTNSKICALPKPNSGKFQKFLSHNPGYKFEGENSINRKK